MSCCTISYNCNPAKTLTTFVSRSGNPVPRGNSLTRSLSRIIGNVSVPIRSHAVSVWRATLYGEEDLKESYLWNCLLTNQSTSAGGGSGRFHDEFWILWVFRRTSDVFRQFRNLPVLCLSFKLNITFVRGRFVSFAGRSGYTISIWSATRVRLS